MCLAEKEREKAIDPTGNLALIPVSLKILKSFLRPFIIFLTKLLLQYPRTGLLICK